MQVSIKVNGVTKALTVLDVLGAGAQAARGPIAAWTSRKPYARRIEYPGWRKAGPAFMFRDGIADTVPAVPGIMGPAIIKGPSAVGGARRQIQNLGTTNIRKRTPVVSGALRDSVEPVSRPRTT